MKFTTCFGRIQNKGCKDEAKAIAPLEGEGAAVKESATGGGTVAKKTATIAAPQGTKQQTRNRVAKIGSTSANGKATTTAAKAGNAGAAMVKQKTGADGPGPVHTTPTNVDRIKTGGVVKLSLLNGVANAERNGIAGKTDTSNKDDSIGRRSIPGTADGHSKAGAPPRAKFFHCIAPERGGSTPKSGSDASGTPVSRISARKSSDSSKGKSPTRSTAANKKSLPVTSAPHGTTPRHVSYSGSKQSRHSRTEREARHKYDAPIGSNQILKNGATGSAGICRSYVHPLSQSKKHIIPHERIGDVEEYWRSDNAADSNHSSSWTLMSDVSTAQRSIRLRSSRAGTYSLTGNRTGVLEGYADSNGDETRRSHGGSSHELDLRDPLFSNRVPSLHEASGSYLAHAFAYQDERKTRIPKPGVPHFPSPSNNSIIELSKEGGGTPRRSSVSSKPVAIKSLPNGFHVKGNGVTASSYGKVGVKSPKPSKNMNTYTRRGSFNAAIDETGMDAGRMSTNSLASRRVDRHKSLDHEVTLDIGLHLRGLKIKDGNGVRTNTTKALASKTPAIVDMTSDDVIHTGRMSDSKKSSHMRQTLPNGALMLSDLSPTHLKTDLNRNTEKVSRATVDVTATQFSVGDESSNSRGFDNVVKFDSSHKVEIEPPTVLHEESSMSRTPGVLRTNSDGDGGDSGKQTSMKLFQGVQTDYVSPIEMQWGTVNEGVVLNEGDGKQENSLHKLRGSGRLISTVKLFDDDEVIPEKRVKGVTWDELTIEAHDLERGSRMKIDEPKTPYPYDLMQRKEEDALYDDEKRMYFNQPGSTDFDYKELMRDLMILKETGEAPSKREKDMKEKRKKHYDEFRVLKEIREKKLNEDSD